MSTEKIPLVQGDDLPRVTLTITDLDDVPVSIAGCTGATIYWRPVGSTAAPTAITADVSVGAGTVAFDFQGGVLSAAGEFEAEVELDFSGLKQTLYRPLKFKVRPQYA